jgi:hypothetical protein
MRIIRLLVKITVVALALVIGWSALRAGSRATVFRRQIVVNVAPQVAWDHFSRPKEWVSWLGEANGPTHLGPSDVIGPETTATFAGNFEFHMTSFEPPRHWMWSAKLGSVTIDYDHIFEAVSDRQTRMVFEQTATGFGNDVMARLLGVLTSLSGHQAALDRLAAEINALPEAAK